MRDIERQIKSGRLKEKACGDVESHFRPFSSIFAKSKKMGYGRTDRWTDIPSYRDARTHLKMLDTRDHMGAKIHFFLNTFLQKMKKIGWENPILLKFEVFG